MHICDVKKIAMTPRLNRTRRMVPSTPNGPCRTGDGSKFAGGPCVGGQHIQEGIGQEHERSHQETVETGKKHHAEIQYRSSVTGKERS